MCEKYTTITNFCNLAFKINISIYCLRNHGIRDCDSAYKIGS